MAKRPIFVSIDQKPFVKTVEAEFQWHGGFAVSQQQKNILALHTAFKAVCPEKRCWRYPQDQCSRWGLH